MMISLSFLPTSLISKADTAASRDACALLKSFHYSSEDESGVNFNNITLLELVWLLRSHQDSLEELCLSFWELDDRTRESTYGFRAFKCLPSLSEFTPPNKLDCHMSCWPDIFLKESMHGEGWHEQTSRRPLNDQEANKWHNRLPSSLTDLIIREMYESPQSEHNIRIPVGPEAAGKLGQHTSQAAPEPENPGFGYGLWQENARTPKIQHKLAQGTIRQARE
jgi:hypothetical protein